VSSKYESSQDLAYKVQWEGGFTAFVFDYGISEAELPDDLPADVREAAIRVISVRTAANKVEDYLGGLT
jgi:hypothetical protein